MLFQWAVGSVLCKIFGVIHVICLFVGPWEAYVSGTTVLEDSFNLNSWNQHLLRRNHEVVCCNNLKRCHIGFCHHLPLTGSFVYKVLYPENEWRPWCSPGMRSLDPAKKPHKFLASPPSLPSLSVSSWFMWMTACLPDCLHSPSSQPSRQ